MGCNTRGELGKKDNWPAYFTDDVLICRKCGACDGARRADRFFNFIRTHYYECHGGGGLVRECFEWK